MQHQIFNKIINKQQANALELDIDGESVSIYFPQPLPNDNIPIVYWHLDEVKEDETVAISMCNAIHLYHTNRFELLEKLGYKII